MPKTKTPTAAQIRTLAVIATYGEAGCSRFIQAPGYNVSSIDALFRLKLIESIPGTADGWGARFIRARAAGH